MYAAGAQSGVVGQQAAQLLLGLLRTLLRFERVGQRDRGFGHRRDRVASAARNSRSAAAKSPARDVHIAEVETAGRGGGVDAQRGLERGDALR